MSQSNYGAGELSYSFPFFVILRGAGGLHE